MIAIGTALRAGERIDRPARRGDERTRGLRDRERLAVEHHYPAFEALRRAPEAQSGVPEENPDLVRSTVMSHMKCRDRQLTVGDGPAMAVWS